MENKEYKVLWTESKTAKTGKPYKKLSLEAPEGNKMDVNIFSDFPEFSLIIPGSTILGHLEQKGEYWNIISATQSKRSYGQNYANKRDISKDVEIAQKRTTESVKHAQDRTERSVKLSGAQRDAVLIVRELMGSMGISAEPEIKDEIIKWRNWFLNDETFNNPPPFN